MSDYSRIHQVLQKSLDLRLPPVAMSFCKIPPAGVPQFDGVEPSGCSFWRLASKGRIFYTQKSNYWNCVLGSHTHHIPLPPNRQKDLDDSIGFMSGLGYIRKEELKYIPFLPLIPDFVVYSPLAECPVKPDVVLIAGKPGRLMYLNEAAIRANVTGRSSTLGRPSCIVVPMALSAGVAASTGCMGSRCYTEIKDDELFFGIAGSEIEKVVVALETLIAADGQVMEFLQTRRSLASE